MAKVTNKKVRVAMIGAGGMVNAVHYPSLASFDDVDIAAICDINTERLNTTADKYNVDKRYVDYRQMVEEVAPDAVYAVGQPHILFDVWVWLLQQKQNLYIEKPMGLTIHQARVLRDLAEQNDCITQVSFQRRCAPIAVQLKNECLKRGPITHAVCRFYKNVMAAETSAYSHMMNDGVHLLDTIRWMCGGEVVDVQTSTNRIGYGDINYYSAIIEFDSGARGVMMANWASGRRIFDVEMHAPGIYAQLEHESKGYLYADGDYNGVEYDTKQVAGSDEFYVFGGFQAKNRNYIDCLKSGEKPESHFGDAVKTMELAEVILAQALLDG